MAFIAYRVLNQLTKLRIDPDGSFIQKFEQLSSTVPVEYRTGNGSFAGYWITIEAEAIFQYETAVVWSNYGCETGYPRSKCIFPAIENFRLALEGGNANDEMCLQIMRHSMSGHC
jgi:hypothetical protein